MRPQEIMQFFNPESDGLYGAGLSQTSHGLQTAWHAEKGGFDAATIVAAGCDSSIHEL